ncbi:CHAP domain-containing protein [Actinospica durhamensis]|uniref:CHAP domain-containing protein n=1 Tax=Actinospica durhamensis TaxID=1508375 RepID=A0A941IR71_9ACTN|nr:PKD domain-containing protein [Actinospica durhamensis]MBR7834987.1 CHAP domain-containing protein [Actinospica durhamensis]
MARTQHGPRRARRTACGGAVLALTLLGSLSVVAAPAAQASQTSGPTDVRVLTPTQTDLSAFGRAFGSARALPAKDVGAIRPDSVREVRDAATGTEWAVAGFVPSASAGVQVENSFQDGSAKQLLERVPGGAWTVVPATGPVGCASTLPSAVRDALGLGTVNCSAGTARPSAAAVAAAKSRAASTTDTSDTSLGDQIAALALGQVGVATTPAETGFGGVDCDPYSTLVAAFSPNSDGCGPDQTHSVENQNEAWCSDFAKWAWTRAGVTEGLNTLNAGSVSFYAWALADGQDPVADSGTPEPGDAVVFFPPGTVSATTYADHVGIVASVNADGTVNLVDGDFLGADGITVEYDQNLDLTSWASSVWSTGEQWVLVAPPSAASQQPAPSAAIVAPTNATAGTSVDFTALATEQGGTIAQDYWTFGDGRDNNVTGTHVSHVFQRAGFSTVTLTTTSSLGTVAFRTWNVGVGANGSAVSSVPSNDVWYTTVPVEQYLFTDSSSGADGSGSLAADSWDGASWLQQTVPGTPAAGASITGLTYSDGDAGYATVPHAFYPASGGGLGETYIGVNGWTSVALPGQPGATSAVAASAADPVSGLKPSLNVTPSLYFFDATGALDQTTESAGSWSSAALPVPATGSPQALAAASTGGLTSAQDVFYLDTHGRLVEATNLTGSWVSGPVPTGKLGVAAGTTLAAASTGAQQVDVFFTDAAGKLAVADSPLPGIWSVHELAATPAAGTALTAGNYLTAAGSTAGEVSYLTSSGTPAVTAWDGTQGQTTALPATASAIAALSSNTVPGTSQQVFLDDAGALGVDASATAGSWSYAALPSTPTAYPGTVLLYAATPADEASALAAAASAGLADSQVTTDFQVAWGATLSGDYLVIAVGQAALNALYDNPCGWANPSADDPGSSPFYEVFRPLNVTLANLFLDAAASTAAQTPQRAADMAYYAVHGALPTGASLPAVAYPGYTCLGQSS